VSDERAGAVQTSIVYEVTGKHGQASDPPLTHSLTDSLCLYLVQELKTKMTQGQWQYDQRKAPDRG
jgi:hypothetical protein